MPTATKSKIQIRPLGEQVLIDPDESPSQTPGGLVLPDNAKDRPSRGTVLAAGTGRLCLKTGERIPLEVQDGDRVLFQLYAGQEVEHEEKKLRMIRESDILGVIES